MRLKEATKRYIAYKRTTGREYVVGVKVLARFLLRAGDVELTQISQKLIQSFLGVPSRTSQSWLMTYCFLRKFFDYWAIQERSPQLPMPARPARAYPRVHSYVFTSAEIRRLLRACDLSQSYPRCYLDATTLRATLVLLYGTGMAVCELLDLRRADVDCVKGTIWVWNRRYNLCREIPIGADLRAFLSGHFKHRESDSTEDPLFTDRWGAPISQSSMIHAFERLRKIAKISREDSKVGRPSLLDLRVTFAVNRIRAWIKSGTNLNRMLPALAAYLGQSGLQSIEKYLDLSPDSYKPQLAALSLDRPRKRRSTGSANRTTNAINFSRAAQWGRIATQ
jgi:integrase